MANLPTPPAEKRILRDLPPSAVPLVLPLAWGFPLLPPGVRPSGASKGKLFEGGRVVAWSSPPEDRDTAYASSGGTAGTPWELRRAGPFWGARPVQRSSAGRRAPHQPFCSRTPGWLTASSVCSPAIRRL